MRMIGGCTSSSSRRLLNAIVLVAMATSGGMSSSSDSLIATTTIADVINSDIINSDVIAAARCRVRCLSLLLKSSIDILDMALLSTVQEMTSLLKCLQDSECSTCMKPCNQPMLSLQRCDVCQSPKEDEVCSESCVFLKEIRRGAGETPGLCPSIPSSLNRRLNVSRGGRQSCSGGVRRVCVSDLDCDEGHMCCAEYCGLFCRKTVSPTTEDFPPVPQTPTLKEKTKSGSVELKWNSVIENGEEPVLYIVDSRWNIVKHRNEGEMSRWQQVAQTTSTAVVISDITPGLRYQFRVSAVSILGSRGGSAPTPAFTLSKEPRRPGPPTNLTEGDTLIAGGKMTVTIRWFPPKKSDLPVTRYKLFWSKRQTPNAGQSMENRVFRKVLPGNRLTFQMQDLESDTTYIVQVQAICEYGENKLKSEKSGIYITTYPLPKTSEYFRREGAGGMHLDSAGVEGGRGEGGRGEGGGGRQLLPTPAPVTRLFVGKSFYVNGSLNANVTWNVDNEASDHKFFVHWSPEAFLIRWSPEACIADSAVSDVNLSKVMSSTTSERHFLIYDLFTDCRYMVKVEPVSSQGITGKAAFTSFSSLSCVQSKTSEGPRTEDCLSSVPRIPGEPPDLSHTFLISNSNITSKLSWGIPTSESPIVGYRVAWGPIVRLSHHQSHPPSMDKTLSNAKLLPKDVRNLTMGNLLEATTYLVEVQAITKFAQGLISSIQFATPLLQLSPIGQPYRELFNTDKKQNDNSKKRTTFTLNTTTIMMTTTTTTSHMTDRQFVGHETHSVASLATNDHLLVLQISLLLLLLVNSDPLNFVSRNIGYHNKR